MPIDNYSTKQFADRLDALRDFCFTRNLGYQIEIFQTYVTVEIKDQAKGAFFSAQGPNIPVALDNLIIELKRLGYI